MKSQKEIQDKLNQIIANEPSKWLEEANYRFENKAWLRKSQAIALKILRHIRANGISQKELAEKLNVAPQQVNRWVKGSENFTLETISRIENVLDIQLINVSDSLKKTENTISFKNEIPFELDIIPFSIIENYKATITKTRYNEVASNVIEGGNTKWAMGA
jgi:transcriptional regulator with XRE-family HTH domain